MARIVKEDEYASKRKEILEAAQRLIYTKGYEQVTIQDILAELKISKGAFYHYFGSKHELLEGIIAKLRQDVEIHLTPLLENPHLPALEKLHLYFDTAARWKTGHKDFVLALLDAWYADHNALVRQKVQAATVQWIAPALAQIIRQGIQEGSLSTPYPEQAGSVIMALMNGMGDTAAALLLASELDGEARKKFDLFVAAYTDALERVLGAAPGSIRLIEPAIMDEWFGAREAKDYAK